MGLMIAPAYAARCNTRPAIIKFLADKYSEAPVKIGITSKGYVLEVLASESGSWTIIITRPNGISCYMASGRAWETIKPIRGSAL